MDVAQNSVRAEASLVFITVEESDKNDFLSITIKDNGCGMTEEQVQQVIDPFFTTRTTRKVGLGVPLFKMSAEQTGGRVSIESELGRGTQTCAEYVKSHVDMTPLGDINSTVSILIRCNPDIDFVNNFWKNKLKIFAEVQNYEIFSRVTGYQRQSKGKRRSEKRKP